MENKLFKRKSLESISSPDKMHDYMRVTSPRLWVLLSAIVAALAGVIVFASTVTMENTVPLQVETVLIPGLPKDEETGFPGDTLCVFGANLPMTYQSVVKPGMAVRLGKEKGTVGFISVSETDGEPAMSLVLDMDDPTLILPAGFYDGELVLESTTLISFFWN